MLYWDDTLLVPTTGIISATEMTRMSRSNCRLSYSIMVLPSFLPPFSLPRLVAYLEVV
jgi:hypothetical protein